MALIVCRFGDQTLAFPLFPPAQEYEDNGGELRSGTLNQMQAKVSAGRTQAA